MFGVCSGNAHIVNRVNEEIKEHLEKHAPWVENMVGWKIGGESMVRHGGGLWGIVRGGMTGAVEAAGGEDVGVENFGKLRGCPGWIINAGLVPVGLKQLVKMMVGFSEGGASGEVCFKKKGAKMGVGEKNDCECKVCRVNDKAEKVHKWVANKCLDMCKEIWEGRCEHWADYCQLHEIEVPRSFFL